MISPLVLIDFYKTGHHKQYPEGTELVFSNFTPRSGYHANVPNKDAVVFFGLQGFLKNFIHIWEYGFFKRPKSHVLAEHTRLLKHTLGDESALDHIAALWDLQYLPLEFRAVPEGTLVPVGVPCLVVYNTKPEFYWLTNYIETMLSNSLWLPCTSATTAYNYRKLCDEMAEKTGGDLNFVDFQCHDFSFRGMGGLDAAMISGAAHLTSFKGTDTVPSIPYLESMYNTNIEQELVGCSVPATEHSVMCLSGEETEIETFRRLITQTYPAGIVSIVSDTWDFWKVITEYATTLHQEIMSREGKVVFRPDSGDPVKVICGMPRKEVDDLDWDQLIVLDPKIEVVEHNAKYYRINRKALNSFDVVFNPVEISEPEAKGAIECLWEIFGGTVNEKGYKVLDSHVGLIYGDSITHERAQEILQRLEQKGFASTNIVFGVGSYTYQHVTRDTWGWAIKATFGVVNGEPRNICKKPKTDSGKNSARGLLAVRKGVLGELVLKEDLSWEEFDSDDNELRPVFRDGKLLVETTLSEIRERIKACE